MLELPNLDHRDADITLGGRGNPACPTGSAHPNDSPPVGRTTDAGTVVLGAVVVHNGTAGAGADRSAVVVRLKPLPPALSPTRQRPPGLGA